MKNIAKLFFACLLLAPAFAAAQQDQVIDEASIMIEEVYSAPAQKPLPWGGSDEEPTAIDSVKKIVNYAFKVIDFIEKNHPVVNIETDYANAVPEQLTHWTQMTGWQGPDSKTYKFSAKNAVGMEVVTAYYKVHYVWGGSFRGRGKYLTGVTIEPVSITTAWACKLDASAEVKDEDIANIGTETDPVASMVLRLKWKVKTFTKEIEEEAAYRILGNGTLHASGKLFERGLEAKAAARMAKTAEMVKGSSFY